MKEGFAKVREDVKYIAWGDTKDNALRECRATQKQVEQRVKSNKETEDAARAAHRTAGRRLAFFQAMDAQIAFHCRICIVIVLHGAEGAGFHALLAPDAELPVDEHDALVVT